jgi:hypothetical protein
MALQKVINAPRVRKAKTTLFAFRGAKSREWTFCDPVKETPKSMTGNVGHWFVRKAKMTLFAFRGVKSHEWTFCDPIKS